MTLPEALLGITFVTGALFTGWIYSLTDRGRSIGRDTQLANRRSRWWMRKAFLARHWPMFVLITAYTLAFGIIASALDF